DAADVGEGRVAETGRGVDLEDVRAGPAKDRGGGRERAAGEDKGVVAVAQVDIEAGGSGTEGKRVDARSTDDGLDVIHRQRVGTAVEVEGAGGEGRTEGDVVVLRAAGDGLDVIHRQRVGAGRRERQAVGAAVEVDRARTLRRAQRDDLVAVVAGDGRGIED